MKTKLGSARFGGTSGTLRFKRKYFKKEGFLGTFLGLTPY